MDKLCIIYECNEERDHEYGSDFCPKHKMIFCAWCMGGFEEGQSYAVQEGQICEACNLESPGKIARRIVLKIKNNPHLN
jgi:hypothetical protein